MDLDATPTRRKRALDEPGHEASKKRKLDGEDAESLTQTLPSENASPPLQSPLKPQLPAPTPTKIRPAIKLAALRGTKWDTGEPEPSPSPRKRTPGRPRRAAGAATPTSGRRRGRKPKDEDVATGLESEGGLPDDSPSKTSTAKKLFGATALADGSLDFTVDELSATERPGRSLLTSRSYNLNKRLAESTGASPLPKGILTPSRKRGPRPQKSVTFNRSSNSEVFFEDLPKRPSTKKPRAGRKPKQVQQEVADDEITCAICSRPDSQPPNEIILCDNCDFAAHQVCYQVLEIPAGDWLCKSCAQEDVLNTPKRPSENAVTTILTATVAPAVDVLDVPDIPNLDRHLRALQRALLDRCAGRRRIRMFGQQEQYEKAHQLVEQTVVAGEGNSMLLIGPRGCGKTTMVENIIRDLSRGHRRDFHAVRLNGFIHTDDKLALKEIWRQLGKEMQVEDDLLNRSNYADTMASLLALLSHPSEILGTDEGVTCQSVIFVIDEFDMFAAHPRQTLLYNLFDIAQSRKAPIAVMGCTTRLDVVEMLEKRVKSRFSHRYIYLSFPKNLPAYWQICRQGLMLGDVDAKEEGIDSSLEGHGEFQKYWNRKIEELYKEPPFQDLLQYHYYTTKSPSAFFAEWILPLSSLSASKPNLSIPSVGSELTSLAPPDSRMQLLSTLSDLDLGLLIAAARLDIVADTDTVNFAMAYDEYSSLVGRQRVQSATSGMLAAGGNTRVWSRGVAGIAWERLIMLGLLVPAGVGGVGAGSRTLGHGGLDGKMWKVDVALEEIPTATKLSTVLAKWCKEI